MTYDQLEHAIRAACNVSGDSDLYIFGSQAILGQHPEAPPELRTSVEVDVQPKNHPETIGRIDGALGELSPFHNEFGFYVHGVSIESATLPDGWQDRTIAVCDPVGTRGNTGHCLEAHDLAASKLFAYREKDRDFVRVLLIEDFVNPDLLQDRIDALAVDEQTKTRLKEWISVTSEEL